jgi:hypothetical protein
LDAPWLGYPGGSPFPYTVSKNAPFAPRGLFLTQKADMQTPNVYSWNLSLQQQIGTEWLLSGSYIGTRTLHVWGQYPVNPAVFLGFGPCTLDGVQYSTCSATTNTDARRILSLERPQDGAKIGPMAEFDDGGVQRYNGMLLGIQRRAGRNLTFNANYTWSHCQGNFVDINQNGPPADETYTKPGDRNFDRGDCISDRRQLFNVTTVVQTPSFANRALNLLGSGWSVSGIYRWASGAPLNVESGVDRTLTGVLRQRPYQILANPYKDESADPLTQWLNPDAFALPDLGTYGNVGYNSIVGPATWSFYTALSRSFSINEGKRVELRAEAFNVLNSFRPGNPNTVLTNNTFGQIRTALDPRILQFAVKFVF